MKKLFLKTVLFFVLMFLPSAAFAQSIVETIPFAGVERSYILHVPANYNPQTLYALMVVYHGTGGSGMGMESITNFDALADQYGFFVVYPNSVGSQWQLTGQNNDFEFSALFISAIESSYAIDPTRVYLSGYSEGGGMATQYACANSPYIAGLGVVSENFDANSQADCTPTNPETYVLFHGTADPISPYDGGLSDGLSKHVTFSAEQTAGIWVALDGCTDQTVTTNFPDVLSSGLSETDSLELTGGCRDGASVSFYTITGGGHTWPGGLQTPNATLGPISEDVNASLIMWQNLSPHHSLGAVAGTCGAANGMDVAVAPTSLLCNSGAASGMSGNGPWTWTCDGFNGGASTSCSADLIVPGICGAADHAHLQSEPLSDLCASGTPSHVFGEGPWAWVCYGTKGGGRALCWADQKREY